MSIDYLKHARQFTEDPDNFTTQNFEFSYQKLHDTALIVLKTRLSQYERINTIEQLIESAIHLNKLALASHHLSSLSLKFPNSKRVGLLQGLLLEKQSPDLAFTHYTALLETYPTLLKARKRIIALSPKETQINLLVEHLDVFSGDQEAWSYLAELYESNGLFDQACFCVEEMIMGRPTVHFNYTRIGRLLLLRGEFKLGLKYYCRAVELCDSDVVGLKGILESVVGIQVKSEVHVKLVEMANMLLNRID